MLAVLAAETVHYFYPKLVEMHNYSAANSNSQKMYNWQTLNSEYLPSRLHQCMNESLSWICFHRKSASTIGNNADTGGDGRSLQLPAHGRGGFIAEDKASHRKRQSATTWRGRKSQPIIGY